MGRSGVVKGTHDKILVAIWMTILPRLRLTFSECLEYDDCLWVFGNKAASPDDYLNEYGDFFLFQFPD